MLAMKPGEDARDLTRRRDLWITCHGQKLLMRMLNTEYERAADASVPGSAAGFTRGRDGPEGTLLLRLAQEQSMLEGAPLFIGFLDFGTFFMSCVKEIQWEVERWTGVDPAVTEVVRELHSEVGGRYETAFGLSAAFGIDRGNGQGCVNGAVRSKLVIGVLQRMISKHVPGYRFTGAASATPQVVFADDCAYCCHDMASLQLAFDTCWMMAKVCGLPIKIKAKSKSAYFATYWAGTEEKDVSGYELRLPDGRVIPQIVKRPKAPLAGAKADVYMYKHLGTELAPGWRDGMSEARAKVVTRCTQVLKLIGRIPVLTNEQMQQMMSLAIDGVIGYYGRATPLRWRDCQQIERARAHAVRQRGFSPSVPRLQVYAGPGEGGLGHAHAYQTAAAALVDQIDRALCGGDGEPARVAVEAAIASTCWRLGCRGDPLAWDPQHARAALSEDMVVEAWLLAKLRTGLVGMPTGRPFRPWQPDSGVGKGPLLWERGGGEEWDEVQPCRYRKRLAEVGMVWWADVTDSSTGGWLSWAQAQARYGGRLGGKVDKRDYDEMMEELGREGNAPHVRQWRSHVAQFGVPSEALSEGEGVRAGADTWVYTSVVAARRAPECFGGWEYRVRWGGHGGETWEMAHTLQAEPGGRLAMDLAAARSRKCVPHSLRDRMERLLQHREAAQRARGARLIRACEAEQADNASVEELFQMYKLHAARLAGGVSVAEDGNLREVPRAEGMRGEQLGVEEYQTLYLGGRETVAVLQADGSTVREERSRAGLEPSTARDAALPVGSQVTEEAWQQAVDAEAMNIVADAGREMAGLPPVQRPELTWWASDVIDCVRQAAGSHFWRTGGSDNGYTEIGNAAIASDPVLRLFLRSDDVEVSGGVRDSNGVHIECDAEEKKMLKDGATECWWVRWVCLNLHAWHRFTHAVATDGSLKPEADGSARLSAGLWEGVQPLDMDAVSAQERWRIEKGDGESEESIKRRVGAGLWGAAVPQASLDTIEDAEMYAVLLYLRKMVSGGVADALMRRCLVLSDCQPALQAIEGAWRKGCTVSGREGDRGAMLEEICRLRAMLGRCVFLWVPSHRGDSANAMADAAAKAYLGQLPDHAGVARIADSVHTRPCLYGVRVPGGGSIALRDRRVYKEARSRAGAKG